MSTIESDIGRFFISWPSLVLQPPAEMESFSVLQIKKRSSVLAHISVLDGSAWHWMAVDNCIVSFGAQNGAKKKNCHIFTRKKNIFFLIGLDLSSRAFRIRQRHTTLRDLSNALLFSKIGQFLKNLDPPIWKFSPLSKSRLRSM